MKHEKLRSSISLDNEGVEHVWAEFSVDDDVVIVHHTKYNKDLHKPIEIPVEILGAVIRVLKDADQYLRPMKNR